MNGRFRSERKTEDTSHHIHIGLLPNGVYSIPQYQVKIY